MPTLNPELIIIFMKKIISRIFIDFYYLFECIDNIAWIQMVVVPRVIPARFQVINRAQYT